MRRMLPKCVAGCFFLAFLGLAIDGPAFVGAGGKEKPKFVLKVKVGDTVPAFEGIDENGMKFKSTSVVGKKILVLYFYPADFITTCTAQASGFRDEFEKNKNVVVVGVSGDYLETHRSFKEKTRLPFSLLADPKGDLALVFGVPFSPGIKSVKVKNEKGARVEILRGATIPHYTYVIGLDGKVIAADPIGEPHKDAKRVAAIIQKLDTK